MKHFIDSAQIEVKAGDGGNGLVSFRREKYVPKGGPDGGNGGDGGNIYIEVNSQLTTLYDFTHRHRFVAQGGGIGKDAQQIGKSGQDLVLIVPVGTIVYEHQNPNTPQAKLIRVVDLDNPSSKVLIARGGIGGRGNTTFKSSTNQAPRRADPGTLGEHKHLVLELKIVADIGLIGLPNAGKSTLLSRLTAARPKIAEYPFTTLSPNLGVMEYHDRRIVLADIPGLIEGAAQGRGLGDDFLRHIERTRILLHLIDPLYTDPIQSYQTIRQELRKYSEKLLDKPEIVVITKLDVTEAKESLIEIKKRFEKKFKIKITGISAASGVGLDELKEQMLQLWQKHPQDAEAEVMKKRKSPGVPIFSIDDLKHF